MELKNNSFFSWLFGSTEEKALENMDKNELEIKGRAIGIELDKRRNKEALIKQLKKQQKIGGTPKLTNIPLVSPVTDAATNTATVPLVEVQKLAERSSEASGRIEELVKNINQDINNAVFLMETTTKEIASGVRMTDETEAIFDRIKSSNQQLVGSISQFAGGSREELETMESISDRIEMLNISSRRNNSNASEVANSMGQLKDVAQRLNQSIMRLKAN